MNFSRPNIILLAASLLAPASVFAAKPPKNRISEEKAKTIALKVAPGDIKSTELEFEKKAWVYSFDIKGSDNQLHEVLVNAKNEKIVSSTIESAAKEAAEKASEEK